MRRIVRIPLVQGSCDVFLLSFLHAKTRKKGEIKKIDQIVLDWFSPWTPPRGEVVGPGPRCRRLGRPRPPAGQPRSSARHRWRAGLRQRPGGTPRPPPPPKEGGAAPGGGKCCRLNQRGGRCLPPPHWFTGVNRWKGGPNLCLWVIDGTRWKNVKGPPHGPPALQPLEQALLLPGGGPGALRCGPDKGWAIPPPIPPLHRQGSRW